MKDEFELRGILAKLKCWHRLTQAEQADLLRFVAAQPDLTDADRKTYQAGHNAGVAHHKQATKREWVDLTEQEALDCFDPNPVIHSKNVAAKLKEKNT